MDLKLLKRNEIYRGRVFNTVVDEVEYPSGRKTVREVARHPGGAAVLGVFDNLDILMIRQHRYPIDKFIWELPAGKLDPGEDPLHCAQREFAEETGHKAEQWREIIRIYTSPGFCDETLYLYLAREISPLPEGRKLEEGEQTMTLHSIPLRKAEMMIIDGEINDAKTIIAILLGRRLLNPDGNKQLGRRVR